MSDPTREHHPSSIDDLLDDADAILISAPAVKEDVDALFAHRDDEDPLHFVIYSRAGEPKSLCGLTGFSPRHPGAAARDTARCKVCERLVLMKEDLGW